MRTREEIAEELKTMLTKKTEQTQKSVTKKTDEETKGTSLAKELSDSIRYYSSLALFDNSENGRNNKVARRNKRVPNKRATKRQSPITRGSKAAYGIDSVRWSIPTMINMIAAEHGFTRTATDQEEVRLERSAANSNTTSVSNLWNGYS